MVIDLKESEKWVARRKIELAAAKDGALNNWGSIILDGTLTDFWTGEDFIQKVFTQQIEAALPKDKQCVIADFCCGNSHLAQTIFLQLAQLRNDPVVPFCLDRYFPSVQATKNISPDVQPVQGNLFKLPFLPNSLDAVSLRNGLPFTRKAHQPQALQEIYNVLKPGGVLIVLNDGVFKENKKVVDAYNTLFAHGASANGHWTYKEIRANRHFPSAERLIAMAANTNFMTKAASDLTDTVLGYMSPEIYAKVFKLDTGQRRRLEAKFEAWKKNDILPFEPHSLRVLRPMYTCVFKK